LLRAAAELKGSAGLLLRLSTTKPEHATSTTITQRVLLRILLCEGVVEAAASRREVEASTSASATSTTPKTSKGCARCSIPYRRRAIDGRETL
jgi:hypothetical protein